MKDTYMVSIVMAVYNVAPFLEEAIESVVKQDIGVENIQLILVDDGSKDESGAICDRYAAHYPESIECIHKTNGGASSARNEGLNHVKGKYVNFLDADDKLAVDACKKAVSFLEQYGEKTDIVSLPILYFDAENGEHALNYKYRNGTRLVNLNEEWNIPQLSISSCFVKKNAIADLQFDTRLHFAEDAKLVQKVLLRQQTLGLLSETAYWYRRRSIGEASAIQSGEKRKDYYLPRVQYFSEWLIHYCMGKHGEIPRFVQYAIMYDLQWRFKTKINQLNSVLSEQEANEYKQRLFRVLRFIDDEVILAQRNISETQKKYLITKKYPDLKVSVEGGKLRLKTSENSYSFTDLTQLEWDFFNASSNEICAEGRFFIPESFSLNFRLKAFVNGTECNCETRRLEAREFCFEESIAITYAFKVWFPKRFHGSISMQLNTDNSSDNLTKNSFGKFFPLSKQYPNSYYICGNDMLTADGEGVIWQKAGFFRKSKQRIAYSFDLLHDDSENSHIHEAAKKAVVIRPIAAILRFFARKPIWLVSDRVIRADDNGRAFFEYLVKAHPEIDAKFVISKESKDYSEIQKIGNVIGYNSFWHKIYGLIAEMKISSAGEDEVFDPFAGHSEAYKDFLAEGRFVFLQHGIIKDDLSDWLNRYNKNIFGFITSVKPEYDSVVQGKYDYPQDNVWLTGLPRFDKLHTGEAKYITIMPTWRHYDMVRYDPIEGKWVPRPDYTEGQFYKFYNELINDERLLSEVKRHGCRLAFFPHPNVLTSTIQLFKKNEEVEFLNIDTAYRDVYAQSCLLVTDYSSAVFDFAYLRKPILYTQFDKEQFFAGEHVYTQGYFDYEMDGFGEVLYSLEDTVNTIIDYLDNGCELKEKYRTRADAFFAFSDKNNCDRVYQKIMQNRNRK